MTESHKSHIDVNGARAARRSPDDGGTRVIAEWGRATSYHQD